MPGAACAAGNKTRYSRANANFEASFPELDFIIEARVVEDSQR